MSKKPNPGAPAARPAAQTTQPTATAAASVTEPTTTSEAPPAKDADEGPAVDFKAADRRSACIHVDTLDLSDEFRKALKDQIEGAGHVDGDDQVIHVVAYPGPSGELGAHTIGWVPRQAAAA